MKSLLSIACVGVAIVLSSLPASAREVTGLRGNNASGSTIVTPNRVGGSNIAGQGSFRGVNGATSNGQVRIYTNGQGSAVYGGVGTVTKPNGQSATITTRGNSSYDRSSGYRGQNTTTVNGTVYNANTQNGVTTITSPNGTRSIDYRPRR
jgi:hypothetical protein